METRIERTLREVYGTVKAYPVNEQAKRLAALAGTKTLTADTLRTARDMGFDLVYVDRFGAVESWSDNHSLALAKA
jgi:hypothetical protein